MQKEKHAVLPKKRREPETKLPFNDLSWYSYVKLVLTENDCSVVDGNSCVFAALIKHVTEDDRDRALNSILLENVIKLR